MIAPHRSRLLRTSVLAALLGVGLLAASIASAAAPATAGVAGTYRIDAWRDLESRGLYHFFYLDPGGRFYLAGQWKGAETSRFGGTWSVAGDELMLVGVADVNTNQGHWKIPYHRTFRMDRSQGALRLTPLPEKNRFGLMGWPNTFVYFDAEPAVNIPGDAVPSDPKALVKLSEALSPGK